MWVARIDVSFLDDIKDDWYCSSCELDHQAWKTMMHYLHSTLPNHKHIISQAMNSAYSEEWSRSMNDEHNSLLEKYTWDLVSSDSMEPGHNDLSGRWVYKLKRDIDRKITRFKSRWVVKGYLQ